MGGLGRHRKAEKTIGEALDAVFEGRDEVKRRTIDLVRGMKANGRSKDWADGYMEAMSTLVDPTTGDIAKALFEEAWATTE